MSVAGYDDRHHLATISVCVCGLFLQLIIDWIVGVRKLTRAPRHKSQKYLCVCVYCSVHGREGRNVGFQHNIVSHV